MITPLEIIYYISDLIDYYYVYSYDLCQNYKMLINFSASGKRIKRNSMPI